MKPRPFGLSDAVILVVALAMGLAANRLDWDFSVHMARQNLYEAIRCLLELTTPHLAALTTASMIMLLRRPRLARRRLIRCPGAIACTTASAALLVIACWTVSATAVGRVITFSDEAVRTPTENGHGRGGSIQELITGRLLAVYGDQVGFAVAGAWLSLLLSGRWRSERTWLDRLGRAVGWIWIGLTMVFWSRSFFL
jgi:hypothetical protein